MDDVLCNFTAARQKALKENPAIQFPQCQYGFFRNLKPIKGGGQENFEGELLKFGGEEFEDWKTVLKYFKAKYLF